METFIRIIAPFIGWLINAGLLYWIWPMVMVSTFHLPAITYGDALLLCVIGGLVTANYNNNNNNKGV